MPLNSPLVPFCDVTIVLLYPSTLNINLYFVEKKKKINQTKHEKEQGQKRSSRWPKTRKKFIEKNPCCAVCGRDTGKREVHHIKPFHSHPELELEESNLITLCENKKDGVNCHLLFGHLGNYRSFNENVIKDAQEWIKKIKERP